MAKITLNTSLIKQAVLAAQANKRQATSGTKTRGEVRGGGKKPWRQKGTGRARAGSSRSPIWVGGGITFGPNVQRHYKQTMPTKMMRAAVAQLFAYLQNEKKIIISDNLAIIEPKTKLAIKLLADHNLTGKKVTLITKETEPELILACRNLPNITVTTNTSVSILDLSEVSTILIDKASAIARGLAKEEAVVKPVPTKETKTPKTAKTTKTKK